MTTKTNFKFVMIFSILYVYTASLTKTKTAITTVILIVFLLHGQNLIWTDLLLFQYFCAPEGRQGLGTYSPPQMYGNLTL